jgi:hypothetical protein
VATFLFDEDVDMTWFEEQIWPVLAARVPAFENLKVYIDRKDRLYRGNPEGPSLHQPPTDSLICYDVSVQCIHFRPVARSLTGIVETSTCDKGRRLPVSHLLQLPLYDALLKEYDGRVRPWILFFIALPDFLFDNK